MIFLGIWVICLKNINNPIRLTFKTQFVIDIESKFRARGRSPTTFLVNIPGGIKDENSIRAHRNLLAQSRSDIIDVEGGHTCNFVNPYVNRVFGEFIIVLKDLYKISIYFFQTTTYAICC